MKPAKELANAAGAGDLAQVRQLVEKAPALAADWQPIMDACFAGHVDVVRFLLDHGADPNILSKSSHRYRPLLRTVEFKKMTPRGPQHMETVELLLSRGADPLLRGTCWNVNTIVLAAMGETKFIPMLLQSAARPLDVFTAAAIGDRKAVAAFLKKQPALAQAKDENEWTALRYCAASKIGEKNPEGLAAVAELLIAAGADPSPALDPACWSGNLPLVKVLLARGGRLQNGDTLNHAACDGQFEMLDLLVAAGADLRDIRGTEHHGGYTPFGCALTMRSLQGAAWFLDHGIDPNEVGGEQGETGLHVAVQSGAAVPLLKLLVDRGVRVAAKNKAGQTAREVAKAKAHKTAVEYLDALAR